MSTLFEVSVKSNKTYCYWASKIHF